MSALSEVEISDSLPFLVDVKKSADSKNDDGSSKIIAPSIEEVDEDPEILRSLRGQGRYFGIGSDDKNIIKIAEPKCNNCSQRGHLKKNCPHVICTYCGSMDDHYSQHCTRAIKCSNCRENGHYRSQCPQKWKKVYCTICNSKRHSRDRCPSIWRVYLLKENPKINLNVDKVDCYNCGLNGHFGDECKQRRSSRVPNDDGSAFSGDNLSIQLKNEYFEKIDYDQRKAAYNNKEHF